MSDDGDVRDVDDRDAIVDLYTCCFCIASALEKEKKGLYVASCMSSFDIEVVTAYPHIWILSWIKPKHKVISPIF